MLLKYIWTRSGQRFLEYKALKKGSINMLHIPSWEPVSSWSYAHSSSVCTPVKTTSSPCIRPPIRAAKPWKPCYRIRHIHVRSLPCDIRVPYTIVCRSIRGFWHVLDHLKQVPRHEFVWRHLHTATKTRIYNRDYRWSSTARRREEDRAQSTLCYYHSRFGPHVHQSAPLYSWQKKTSTVGAPAILRGASSTSELSLPASNFSPTLRSACSWPPKRTGA